jgi:hypothetical protein
VLAAGRQSRPLLLCLLQRCLAGCTPWSVLQLRQRCVASQWMRLLMPLMR